jgi:2-dehydropantoate 2-reductase
MTRVHIIGTGAIGCLYGSQLSEAGLEVTLINQRLAQTKATIRIDSPWGNGLFTPHQVYENIAEAGSADILIISTKTTATPALIAETAVLPAPTILLLQNGIHIEQEWQTAFPEAHIISGLAFVCCFRNTPWHVTHQDYGRLIIGDFPHGTSPMTTLLTHAWQGVGVPVIASEKIQLARWKKLLWNAAFNPMSVVLGQDTQEILSTAAGEAQARAIMHEVQKLAAADGYTLTDEDIQRNITDTRVMTPYKTSMLLDYENKRPLETEAILGNALRFAAAQQIEVPHIQLIYDQLKKLSAASLH